MKKPLFIIILLIGCHCFGQDKEQQKTAFKYSAGLAYNQIWLDSYFYGIDEYGSVSSSPFNWGITPYFSMAKGRLVLSAGLIFSSCSRKYEAVSEEPNYHHDKWQEASLASTVGVRVTGERSLISVIPFLGFDLGYLINYERTVTYDYRTWHYNTDELDARNYHDIYTWNHIPFPFGLGILGGINVSCPITKHFDIGLSYCAILKVINDIRNYNISHYPSITSPGFYHKASIGISYRFN